MQFHRTYSKLHAVTKPLAFIYYENLFPGSQLGNRLQDIGYRVHVVVDPDQMVAQATQEKPMIVLIELASAREDVAAAITRMKKDPNTAHIPIIAYASSTNEAMRDAGRRAGATMIASDEAILEQLPQLLEHALRVE